MTFRPALAPVLLALLAPATAQAMSVAEFMTKADALKAKGMRAMFSPDLKPVMNEVKAVAAAYRAEVDAARLLGRTDLGCPPPKGKVKFTSTQFLAGIGMVPMPHRASTTVLTAYYAMMQKRFPCR